MIEGGTGKQATAVGEGEFSVQNNLSLASPTSPAPAILNMVGYYAKQ